MRMAIGGAERLGFIDGRIVEPLIFDSKYADCVATMMKMNWILNSMEEVVVSSFHYDRNALELWDSIASTFVFFFFDR